MRQLLKKQVFRITFNHDFESVIENCSQKPRKDQDGTWINQAMIDAYIMLHEKGFAKSVEVWKENVLVGGLYGLAIGNCFFGESMFSHASNASKAGFLSFVLHYIPKGLQLVDCQIHSSHLQSLGAEMVERKTFLDIVRKNSNLESIF